MPHEGAVEFIELGPRSTGARVVAWLLRPWPSLLLFLIGILLASAAFEATTSDLLKFGTLALLIAVYAWALIAYSGTGWRKLRYCRTISAMRTALRPIRVERPEQGHHRMRYLTEDGKSSYLAFALGYFLLLGLILFFWPNETPHQRVARACVVIPLLLSFGKLRDYILSRFAADMTEVQKSYREKPIVLFRSFADDKLRNRLSALYQPSFEHSVSDRLQLYGPVVAIGAPGDASRPIGAARTYVLDGDWKEVADGLMAQSQLMVLMVAETEGLEWEFRRCQALAQLNKLLLLCPPVGRDQRMRRWRFVIDKLPAPHCETLRSIDHDSLIALYFEGDQRAVLLRGDSNEVPHRMPVYSEAIDAALFAILNPWVWRKSSSVE